VGYFREGKECTRFICLEKVVKISSVSSVSSASPPNSMPSNDFEADDKADDKQTIPYKADDNTDDMADGIIQADDKQTIPLNDIVCYQTQQGQGFHVSADDTDDTDDKNSLFSKCPIPEKSLKVGDRVQLLAKTHERSGQTGIIKYFSGWFAAIAWADGSIDISHKTDNLELAEVTR
jgi:hypothetical protein